jgi:hypothetical protein
MSLEKIIRPFQVGDVFTARTIAPVQQPATVIKPDVSDTFGDEDSGGYTSFVLSGLVGGKVIYEEKSRVTQKVRITNPEDDQQWVDVERIQKLVMATTGGDEIHFNFNTPTP